MEHSFIWPAGEVLKDLRETRMLTRKQLAEQCVLAEKTIERVEAGRRAQFNTIRVLAAFFDVAPNELVVGGEALPDEGWVFPQSADQKTLTVLGEHLQICQHARLCAMGLNFLWHEEYISILKNRVRERKMRAEICLANFQHEEILQRLHEEGRSPFGEANSLELISTLIDFDREIGNDNLFSVRLFHHAPTYAMLMFDQNIFIYLYGLGATGGASPTFHIHHVQHAEHFFVDQFYRVWNKAIPACDLVIQ